MIVEILLITYFIIGSIIVFDYLSQHYKSKIIIKIVSCFVILFLWLPIIIYIDIIDRIKNE